MIHPEATAEECMEEISTLEAEIARLQAVLRQIELNTREGSPLILKLNWLAKGALAAKDTKP